jgi:hypothetical protein
MTVTTPTRGSRLAVVEPKRPAIPIRSSRAANGLDPQITVGVSLPILLLSAVALAVLVPCARARRRQGGRSA